MILEDKFLVLKRSDIDAALTTGQRDMFLWLAAQIAVYRVRKGKPPTHKYVVINQDEPYFAEVLRLMEESHEQ